MRIHCHGDLHPDRARVFSLVFQGVRRQVWIEDLLGNLPAARWASSCLSNPSFS